MNKTTCPVCDSDCVAVNHVTNEVEYKGTVKAIPMAICVCDLCGSESAGSSEMKFNRREHLSFRREVEGLLSAKEIKRIRKKFRLTQPQAGKLFGGGPTAFNKYENNDVAQSEALDGILRLVEMNEDAYWNLVDIKEMTDELTPLLFPHVYKGSITKDFTYASVGRVTPIEKGMEYRRAKLEHKRQASPFKGCWEALN